MSDLTIRPPADRLETLLEIRRLQRRCDLLQSVIDAFEALEVDNRRALARVGRAMLRIAGHTGTVTPIGAGRKSA